MGIRGFARLHVCTLSMGSASGLFGASFATWDTKGRNESSPGVKGF